MHDPACVHVRMKVQVKLIRAIYLGYISGLYIRDIYVEVVCEVDPNKICLCATLFKRYLVCNVGQEMFATKTLILLCANVFYARTSHDGTLYSTRQTPC